MFAHAKAPKVLRSFFKSDPLAPAGASAFFFLRAFSFCAFNGKKKKWSSDLNIKIAVSHVIVTFNPDVLFLFLSCEREKEPKREDSLCTLRGVSLTAVSDKAYSALTRATSPVGACIGVCKHGALNINLPNHQKQAHPFR